MNGTEKASSRVNPDTTVRPDAVTWVCRFVVLLASALTAWLFLAPVPASAVPLLWTLDNASFAGGGTVSGSFVYDAQTGDYSDVLVTAEGPVSGDLTFDLAGGGSANGVGLLRNVDAPDFSGAITLRLQFVAPLTDAGGIIGLQLNSFMAGLAGCGNADCTLLIAGGGDSAFGSGTVISEAVVQVSEPGTLALFGAPLLSLLWLRRRKSQKSGKHIFKFL